MASLQLLVSARKHLRTSVTKLYNNRDNYNNLSSLERQTVKAKLWDLSQQLVEADKEILSIKWQQDANEEMIKEEMETRESYQDRVRVCLSIIDSISEPLPPSSNTEMARSLLKSPTAPLPRFESHEGENLELFLSNFELTLSKFSYTDYDKFLLLKQQVYGKASYLIDSLEPDKRTYTDAKLLLSAAYAGTDVQKFNVLKELTEIKLDYNDEPFEFVSRMRKIQQSVSQLKINVDDVIQYFFLNGLNDLFRTQLVQITNNLRPSLDEINEKFFAANERYQVAKKLKKDKFKVANTDVTTLAIAPLPEFSSNANVNPFTSCTLCRDDRNSSNHGINKCTVFIEPSDKIERLNAINACTKCANLGHTSSTCKFRFRKSCHKCSLWHFSFLCCKVPLSENTSDTKFIGRDGKKEKLKKEFGKVKLKEKDTIVSSSIAITANSYETTSCLNSIVSTFTCKLNNKFVRGLSDSGSQCNLIAERCLTGCNYKIIEDYVDLTIKGINQNRNYKSKLVKLSLQFGDIVEEIEAMTLPSINICLNLPGLSKVAAAFHRKGYPLADELLLSKGDCINQVDLILGACAAYCFAGTTDRFGKENKSVFSITQFGVMIQGKIPQLISDIEYLPNYKCNALINTRSNDNEPSAVKVSACSVSCTRTAGTRSTVGNAHYDEEAIGEFIDGAADEILEKQCD